VSAVALAKAELPNTLSRAPLRRRAPFPSSPIPSLLRYSKRIQKRSRHSATCTRGASGYCSARLSALAA
jgi:hypothetical protein